MKTWRSSVQSGMKVKGKVKITSVFIKITSVFIKITSVFDRITNTNTKSSCSQRNFWKYLVMRYKMRNFAA